MLKKSITLASDPELRISDNNIHGKHHSIAFSISNHTLAPIFLTYSDGYSIRVDPTILDHSHRDSHKIIITKTFRRNRAKSNVTLGVAEHYDMYVRDEEEKILRTAQTCEAPDHESHGVLRDNVKTSIDYVYDGSIIFSNEPNVLLHEFNILLSQSEQVRVGHPYSNGHCSLELLERRTAIGDACLNYELRMVKPPIDFGPRWVNVHGHIREVPVDTKSELKSGFYLVLGNELKPNGPDKNQSIHMTYDEADKVLDIFTSFALAKTYGRYKDLGELDQLTTEREYNKALLEAKRENLQIQSEMDKMKRKHEEEKFEIDRDTHRLKYNMEVEKRKTDRSSTARKDLSETLKTGGLILTTLLNVFLLLQKTKD